ncbi:FadR/GntR family transcriptional regulator [Pelagibacterium sp. H642]|uniref:FadR/GntR family transcriptional regulator n=1 Tax=Pelagibacterium sp. H642 TaxID=1881069 RepID=UPI002815722A|nr:FadR/GntR family transcriptional regulator [Pelagibacterium sp. H642]WMT89578.1 FadR family transcriptional regulator [Pelagibacterium sp. H642]
MVMHKDIHSEDVAVLPRLLHGPIKSAHALITRDIAMRILRGEYPPGSLLPPEGDLIDQYTVSRTALREAIKTLAAKGLLVSKTKIGTRVLNESYWNLYDPQVLSWRIELGVDNGFLRKIFEVRQALEPAAAAQAALRRTPLNIERMQYALNLMDKPHHTRKTYAEPDLVFHQEVLIASGNPFMQTFSSIIEACILNAFAISAPIDNDERFKRSINRHALVLAEIRDGNPNGAGQAMSEVIRESIENARFGLADEPVVISLPLDLEGTGQPLDN